MGFYFFSLYFLGKRIEKKWLMWWGIFLAFFLGTLLSWARMAQGGHFLSDNIVSLLIMAGTAYVLDTYTSRITEFLNQYR
jgi:membrane-associated PAP2 superfamily phosphatase